MMKDLITTRDIVSQIYFIRGINVMLDFHLAALYHVETRVLKQQVKRNLSRFPDDFMFQLTESEWKELITICDNLGSHKFSPASPFAFTEQGVAMLSGILRSQQAIQVNISIMRAFVKMRDIIDGNKELKQRLDTLEKKFDQQFKVVFDAIRLLVEKKEQAREPVGYKINKK
jgi:chromosome condensin MukBEF ATPase and DNA-binding subunit MukB